MKKKTIDLERRLLKVEKDLQMLWPCFMSDFEKSENSSGYLAIYAVFMTSAVVALFVKVFIL